METFNIKHIDLLEDTLIKAITSRCLVLSSGRIVFFNRALFSTDNEGDIIISMCVNSTVNDGIRSFYDVMKEIGLDNIANSIDQLRSISEVVNIQYVYIMAKIVRTAVLALGPERAYSERTSEQCRIDLLHFYALRHA